MIDSLSTAVHAFVSRVSMSFSRTEKDDFHLDQGLVNIINGIE